MNVLLFLNCVSFGVLWLGKAVLASPAAYGTPAGVGAFSAQDVANFMATVPDEALEMVRKTFPGMTDIEIMGKLLDGDDEDMERMINEAVDETSPGPTAVRKMAPQGAASPVSHNRLRTPVQARRKSQDDTISQQNQSGLHEPAPAVAPGSPKEGPVVSPGSAPVAPVVSADLPPGLDLSSEEELEFLMFMQQMGPDMDFFGGLQGFPEPPKTQVLVPKAPMEQPLEHIVLDPTKLTIEQIDAIAGILNPHYAPPSSLVTKPQSEWAQPVRNPNTPSQPARSPSTQSESVRDPNEGVLTPSTELPKPPVPRHPNGKIDLSKLYIPDDIRSVIPPRPVNKAPKYPENQLATPYNPIYSYPVEYLAHADPYYTLDHQNPYANKQVTKKLPTLPDAHTRSTLNNVVCSTRNSASPVGPPKFADCSKAISLILPELTAKKCKETSGWPIHKHVVVEFGTCRVVAKHRGGKAGCAELDKVKYLGHRILRECGEGGLKDPRSRGAEGKVGYLFVNEDTTQWEVMEVSLERVVF
ncbi:hypothetical protein DFH27DRAFT_634626 [Peziza echinospora]|nr:hypothetical protein DFH27DRAFT_634626 [Peziza echinospora]